MSIQTEPIERLLVMVAEPEAWEESVSRKTAWDEIKRRIARAEALERSDAIARRALVQFRDNRKAITAGDYEPHEEDWQPTFGESAKRLAAEALDEMDRIARVWGGDEH